MKKRIWILMLMLILAIVLSLYIYSSARQKVSLPRPEDMSGEEASAFLPQKIEQRGRERPAPKGSSDLKLTGPVWIEK